jgi:signal peptidase I
MTVLRRVVDLALVLLVGAVLIVALIAFLAPSFHGRALAIRSASMNPSIGVGALVVTVVQDPATLHVGDVVTIQLAGGNLLTHRIDEIVQQDDRRMFRLRGDANPAPDPVLITQDQLLGRVVVDAPLLGYLLAMMSLPIGVAALLSIGASLIVAGWVLDEFEEPGARRRRPRRGPGLDLGMPGVGDEHELAQERR